MYRIMADVSCFVDAHLCMVVAQRYLFSISFRRTLLHRRLGNGKRQCNADTLKIHYTSFGECAKRF